MSPSIVEKRAKQLQEQRDREERESEIRRENERIRREQEVEAQKQKKENARQAENRRVEGRLNEIMKESGLMKHLKELDNSLSGEVSKHTIVIDMDEQEVTLVWGNKFSVNEFNHVSAEKSPGFLGFGSRWDAEYSSFSIKINSESGELNIQGSSVSRRIPESQWRQNPQAVIDGLAEAYLSPFHNTTRRESDYRSTYDASSSSNTECCHGN